MGCFVRAAPPVVGVEGQKDGVGSSVSCLHRPCTPCGIVPQWCPEKKPTSILVWVLCNLLESQGLGHCTAQHVQFADTT